MITKDDLIDWIKKIDKKLSKKIVVIAVGGTALTLLGLKSSTRDVDFCLRKKDVAEFKKHVNSGPFKVDIFEEGYIFSEQLPQDYIQKSKTVNIHLKKIEFKTLSVEDIILTKLARYNERDEEDISQIMKSIKISKENMIKRYRQIKDTYAGRMSDYEYHFKLFLERFY